MVCVCGRGRRCGGVGRLCQAWRCAEAWDGEGGVVGKPIGVLGLPANNKSDTRNIIKRFSMEYKA